MHIEQTLLYNLLNDGHHDMTTALFVGIRIHDKDRARVWV